MAFKPFITYLKKLFFLKKRVFRSSLINILSIGQNIIINYITAPLVVNTLHTIRYSITRDYTIVEVYSNTNTAGAYSIPVYCDACVLCVIRMNTATPICAGNPRNGIIGDLDVIIGLIITIQ